MLMEVTAGVHLSLPQPVTERAGGKHVREIEKYIKA